MFRWINIVGDIFRTKELREKLYNTVYFITLFRLGSFIVLPGLDQSEFRNASGGFLALLDTLLSSSSLSTASVFSLGISPYIAASIFMQIFSITIPYFQRMKKEGKAGRDQIKSITRYLALLLTPLQGSTFVFYLANSKPEALLVDKKVFIILSLLLLSSGTVFCIWLAERITTKGLGNGSSVLIMVSIISSLPGAQYMEYDNKNFLIFIVEQLLLIVICAIVIAFMQGVRRIPLRYATQMVNSLSGRGGGLRQYLPIGLNTAGVMPIIVAKTLLVSPVILTKFLSKHSTKAKEIFEIISDQYSWQHNVILSILVFTATFFYATIFINTVEMADDLKRYNGFIPGVKPGMKTAEYIDNVLSKITLPASLFLVMVTLMPLFAHKFLGIGRELSRFFGGTSILITIGVILDIGQRIESGLFNVYYNRSFLNYNLPSSNMYR